MFYSMIPPKKKKVAFIINWSEYLFGVNGSNFGTPTVVIMNDLTIVDSIVGEAPQSDIENLLKTFKLI